MEFFILIKSADEVDLKKFSKCMQKRLFGKI